jgi:hypothetical protein
LGQLVSGPLFGDEGSGGGATGADGGDDDPAAGTSGEPPIGAPQVSHHSASLLS